MDEEAAQKRDYIVCTSQAGNEEIIRWRYYPMLSSFFGVCFFAKLKSQFA